MTISYSGLYQSLAEHNRQAMNSWSYSMFDDLRIDDGDGEEWEEEDEWEEEEDDEPPRELTPGQRERINKDLQKILKEAEQKSKEICKGKIFTYRGIPLCKKTRLMNLWKQ